MASHVRITNEVIMRSLGRQEQAVLRELQQALAREDFMLARRIYEANPDLQDEIQALWQQNQRVITR